MCYSKKFISAGRDYSDFNHYVPAPYLRKSFELDFEPDQAELLICGLGFYELYLNGERITRGRLAPYISNPDDLLYYDRYDLSGKLRSGKNTLGFILGNGMQNSYGGMVWDFDKAGWRSAPKLALTFRASGNGNQTEFEADESFLTHPSPIYMDELRIGEFYDAGKEIEGWSLPEFDDSGWQNAIAAEAPFGECREGIHSPIADRREIKPVSIKESRLARHQNCRENLPLADVPEDEKVTEGYLYDFGENCSGRVRLKIRGKKGQKIIMQFGDKLWDGGLDLESIDFLPRYLNHRSIYICKGEGEEIYEPVFSFFGFQYCLVIGITPEQATGDLLTYVVMHGDFEKRADFTCSDETVNKLQEAVIRTDLANFLYFPTDCPHREKNGWTGDANLSTDQFMLNFSAENSLREWLFNIRKAQRSDGALPGIVPTSGWGFDWGNGPLWDSVLTEIPYIVYQYRGDKTIIEENVAAFMRYLTYIDSRRDENGLIAIGLGDWCPIGGKTKSPLILTDSLVIMDTARKAGRMFRAVDRPLLAEFADKLSESLRESIRANLIDENCVATGRCQTSQAAALYYGAFNEDEIPRAFEVLLKLIHEAGDSMDCGILGSRTMFHVLSRMGYSDLALHMIAKPDYPSFGNWIARGSTSMWENFVPEGKNPWSASHHFFGDISAWFIKNLAGIIPNPDYDDCNYILVSPCFVKALDSAAGSYSAPGGTVVVEWKKTDGEGVTLKIAADSGLRGRIKLRDNCTFADGSTEKPLKAGTYSINLA